MQDLYSIPAVYALYIVDIAAQWDVSANALLDDLNLSRELLLQPQARLSLETFNVLLIKARQLTQETGLAIYFGQRMQISLHGFVGFAAMTSSTLREAIGIGERFIGMISSAFSLHLEEGAEESYLYLEEHTELEPLREVAILGLIFGFAHMGQTVTGRVVRGVADVRFAEPTYMQPLQAFLPGRVRYNQPYNRICFPSEYLDLPLLMANPVTSQLALAQCEQELQRFGLEKPLVAQVKALLYDEYTGYATLETVANKLHMSERTLKRQLAQYQVTYSDLVDEARKQKALTLLAQPHHTLDDIAERLGYSDVANFSRAFKRWTGLTPAAWRKL